MKIRVYYEDTDAGGIVYHTKYINFCERARSEMFFQKGLSPHNEDKFFVVSSIEAKFLGSAVLGDILDVKTSVIQVKKFSIILLQEIFLAESATHKKEEIKLFSMNVKVAYIQNGKPIQIPQDQMKILVGE